MILAPKFTEKNLKTKTVKEKEETLHVETKALANDKPFSQSSPAKVSSKVSHNSSEDPTQEGTPKSQEKIRLAASGTKTVDIASAFSPENDRQSMAPMSQKQDPRLVPACPVHQGKNNSYAFVHLNNPQNYKYLPPTFTRQI